MYCLFFEAEDGIRDWSVTGVQTCALPICRHRQNFTDQVLLGLSFGRDRWRALVGEILTVAALEIPEIETAPEALTCLLAGDHYRSEERRVGKEGRSRWARGGERVERMRCA